MIPYEYEYYDDLYKRHDCHRPPKGKQFQQQRNSMYIIITKQIALLVMTNRNAYSNGRPRLATADTILAQPSNTKQIPAQITG